MLIFRFASTIGVWEPPERSAESTARLGAMDITMISASYNYIFGECHVPKPPHHFVGRCYPFIVIVYVERGEYHVVIHEKHYTVRSGEAVVIPEFINHAVYMEKEGVISWAHLSAHVFGKDIFSTFDLPIVFDGDTAKALEAYACELCKLSGVYQSENSPFGNALTSSEKPLQSELDFFSRANIAAIIQTDTYNTIRHKISYDRIIAATIDTLLRHASNGISKSEEDYRWFMDVSQYIHDRIRQKICLEELSKHFMMSVRKFSMKFNNAFQQSPISYVISEKIRYSTWLLLNGSSVKDVAYTLGFTDSYYFTRQFKKHMKCSPTQYKENYKMQYN